MPSTEIKPRIAITMGDPAGVGGEITLKALADPALARAASWLVVGDRTALEAAERITGLSLQASGAEFCDAQVLPADERIVMGDLRPAYGKAAAEYVRRATMLCLDRNASAMVTSPLNKEAVSISGLPFQGHTEYIAQLCGVPKASRMLLASEKLSVVHVSTHIGLLQACRLDVQRIARTIELGHDAMKLLGFNKPRIAVCGLNPHAGEHGLFGTEDERFIAPAIATARERGIDVDGPEPPDTIFLRAVRGAYDLVVAMYHDQGHIPMKLIDFEGAVNISLGIPIIRTSVDHGTAFDIAGQNKANPANMKSAMSMALRMAINRRSTSRMREQV